jgi:hypothetical protein
MDTINNGDIKLIGQKQEEQLVNDIYNGNMSGFSDRLNQAVNNSFDELKHIDGDILSDGFGSEEFNREFRKSNKEQKNNDETNEYSHNKGKDKSTDAGNSGGDSNTYRFNSDSIYKYVDAAIENAKRVYKGSIRAFGGTSNDNSYENRNLHMPKYAESKYSKTQNNREADPNFVPVPSKPYGTYSGPIQLTLGIIGHCTVSVVAAVFLGIMSATAFEGVTTTVFLTLLAALFLPIEVVSVVLIVLGARKVKRLKRFREYVSVLKGKTHCDVGQLAEKSGRSTEYVVNDLKKMISLKMFPQGHLDKQNTAIILNDATYGFYLESEKERINGTLAEHSKNDDEAGRLIKLGDEYISKIKKANEEIQNAKISADLDNIEAAVKKIFDYVGKHTEQAKQLDHFINFYLPTTFKLLEAYKKYDQTDSSGKIHLSESDRESKLEIEKSMDNILEAFVKLYDMLTENEKEDVSSDISAMNAMFARDGLSKDDFKI